MRKTLAFIAALMLTAAACSSAGSAVVASVGGTDITEADLAALFDSDTLPIDEGLREAIFSLAAREVLLQGLDADFGAQLDVAEVDSVYESFNEQMAQAGVTAEQFLGVDNAGDGMVRFNAEIGVIRQQALDGLLNEPGALDLFFSDPNLYTTVCVRHVLVETEEEATAVVDRLEAGEDLAAIASEVSLDSATPGGDLGCAVAGRYVPEFAEAAMTAELGEVYGPIQTQFGFHVLIVDDRSAPTAEEIKTDPQAYLTADEMNSLWRDWFNEKLQAAEVTVDEKYGSWSSVGIVPPDRPDPIPTDE